jgi:hypothetical protein
MTIDNSPDATTTRQQSTEREACGPSCDTVGGFTGVDNPLLGDNTVLLTADRMFRLFSPKVRTQLPETVATEVKIRCPGFLQVVPRLSKIHRSCSDLNPHP